MVFLLAKWVTGTCGYRVFKRKLVNSGMAIAVHKRLLLRSSPGQEWLPQGLVRYKAASTPHSPSPPVSVFQTPLTVALGERSMPPCSSSHTLSRVTRWPRDALQTAGVPTVGSVHFCSAVFYFYTRLLLYSGIPFYSAYFRGLAVTNKLISQPNKCVRKTVL